MIQTCPLCSEIHHTEKKYPSSKNPLGFTHIRNCKKCCLGWAYPVRAQTVLDEFYKNGNYWSGSKEQSIELKVHNRNQARIRVRKVLGSVPKRKLTKVLEIGPGQGDIFYWLSKFNKNSELLYDFVEPDPSAASRIQDLGECKVRSVQIEQLKLANYDLIFLNHVLEHVENPLNFLRLVVPALKKDGMVYIETPCRDDSFKDDVFPHTLFFNLKTFEQLGESLELRQSDIMQFGNVGAIRPSIYTKILFKLYSLSCRWKFIKIAFYIDALIFRYSSMDEKGIWLSTILKHR